ncbi:hypothetical protein CEXT_698721, partial [Caerostris extrusa]
MWTVIIYHLLGSHHTFDNGFIHNFFPRFFKFAVTLGLAMLAVQTLIPLNHSSPQNSTEEEREAPSWLAQLLTAETQSEKSRSPQLT